MCNVQKFPHHWRFIMFFRCSGQWRAWMASVSLIRYSSRALTTPPSPSPNAQGITLLLPHLTVVSERSVCPLIDRRALLARRLLLERGATAPPRRASPMKNVIHIISCRTRYNQPPLPPAGIAAPIRPSLLALHSSLPTRTEHQPPSVPCHSAAVAVPAPAAAVRGPWSDPPALLVLTVPNALIIVSPPPASSSSSSP